MATTKVLYIINPAGHGGAGRFAWEKFKILWSDPIASEDFIITEKPGQALDLAASSEGCDVIAAVGGDGTVGDVISGIMEIKGVRPALAIIPAGTGNDIARNAGIFSIEDAVAALQENCTKEFDLIRTDYQMEGQPAHRYSFLFANVGFSSADVIRPWMKLIMGATGAYYIATFLQILAYKPPTMTLRSDNNEISGRRWMAIIGNTEKAGGDSMCTAPGALSDDGELNVTIFPVRSKWKMITELFPQISNGTYINEPDVDYFPVKKIEVDSSPPSILDLDGDVYGTTPATFTVCPSALKMLSNKQRDL